MPTKRMQNTLCRTFGNQWAWQHTKPPTKWIPNFLKSCLPKKNCNECWKKAANKVMPV